MAWKEFFSVGRGHGSNCVTVDNRRLTIGKLLVERFGLGKYGFAKLRYDDEAKVIGVKFLVEREPGAALVKHGPTFIAASVFIRILGIPNGRYDAIWDEREEMLVCCYDRPICSIGLAA